MEDFIRPKFPEQPHLEAFLSEGNPYPGTEEIEAKEGPLWWKYAENGDPIEPEDDPEDN